MPIPPHGLRASAPRQVAGHLLDLLLGEVERAVEGHERVYLTLSGGLDSRIVAGVTARAAKEGRIPSDITGVSWGRSDSRDVLYGKAVADQLGIEWKHIPLGPEHLQENIVVAAEELGAMVNPVHLHRMLWFRCLDRHSIVLSGSYGDSVGRAEYSGRHLLELSPLRAGHPLVPLLTPDALREGRHRLQSDLDALRDRADLSFPWRLPELEMEAHYMRGLLGPAMSLMETHCDAYQMFTAPEVYSYMWSLHPAFRTDDVYAELLELLSPELARLPWARTNCALRGDTTGASQTATEKFHRYGDWITGELLETVRAMIAPDLLASTGVFSARAVHRLVEMAGRPNPHGNHVRTMAWLASVSEMIRIYGISGSSEALSDGKPSQHTWISPSRLRDYWERGVRRLMKRVPLIRSLGRAALRAKARVTYPPDRK